MFFIISIILALVSLYFWIQFKIINRTFEQIISSLESGKFSILEKHFFLPSSFPVSRFQKVIDSNSISLENLQREKQQRIHEFNEILGRMLDGAIMLELNHRIIFANESAKKRFGYGKKLVGKRLESVLDSAQILETLKQIESSGDVTKIDCCISISGKDLYFEVTGTLLSGLNDSKNETILLLFRDVTEIKRAEIMRKDFVANASHELRTPITIMRGYTEALLDDDEMSKEQGLIYIEKVHRNILRLQELIDDLLSISDLEKDGLSMNFTNNKLSDVVRGVEHYLGEKDYISKNKIKYSLCEEKDSIPMDNVKVAIAISNLIDNAFKYAGEFNELEIRTYFSDNEDELVCSVKDDGIGIPEKDLARIFERFYVVDKGRSREKGGTGLGLSIVKHIAESHGGRVEVESAEGIGTEFRFILPNS